MKLQEIRELSTEELKEKVINLKKELFEMKLQKSLHKLENPAKIKNVKHQIAQIKTVIKEQENKEV